MPSLVRMLPRMRSAVAGGRSAGATAGASRGERAVLRPGRFVDEVSRTESAPASAAGSSPVDEDITVTPTAIAAATTAATATVFIVPVIATPPIRGPHLGEWCQAPFPDESSAAAQP